MTTGTTKLYDEDDLNQEYALAQLTGGRATKSILRRKLSRVWKDNLEVMDHVAIPAPPETETAKLDWLLDWASDAEDPRLLQIIQTFSLDPENLYEVTIQSLQEIIELHQLTEKPRERFTYSQMIANALPATYDDLLAMLGRERIKRPAATLRQWLRRHKDSLSHDEYDRIIRMDQESS